MIKTMKGVARRFWTLVTLALAAEALVVVAAVRTEARVLPCWWALARPAGWIPGAVCERPLVFVGYRSWLPVTILAAVVLTSALFMVAVAGGRMFMTRRMWSGLRRQRIDAPAGLVAAAESAGLVGRRVVVVDANEAFSFCRGLVFPQVVVSSGLVDALEADELKAVLVHEAAHARRRDPLRALVAHSVAAGLFFLPTMGELGRGTLVDAELGADATACSAVGRRTLVQALLVVLGADRPALGLVAEMAGVESLELRIAALRTGKLPAIRLRPRLLVGSAVAVAALCLMFVWLPQATTHFVGGTGVHITGSAGVQLTQGADVGNHPPGG